MLESKSETSEKFEEPKLQQKEINDLIATYHKNKRLKIVLRPLIYFKIIIFAYCLIFNILHLIIRSFSLIYL